MISHVDVAHGYFAYVNEISFAYPEHLVHEGVAGQDLTMCTAEDSNVKSV